VQVRPEVDRTVIKRHHHGSGTPSASADALAIARGTIDRGEVKEAVNLEIFDSEYMVSVGSYKITK